MPIPKNIQTHPPHPQNFPKWNRVQKLLAFLLLFSCSWGIAQEGDTLQNLRFGTHWYGPDVTQDDLAGKVVLFEMWGT